MKNHPHDQLVIHQKLQLLLCQLAFQMDSAQHVLVPGVIPPQVQDFVLPFVELYEVPVRADQCWSQYLPLRSISSGLPTYWTCYR